MPPHTWCREFIQFIPSSHMDRTLLTHKKDGMHNFPYIWELNEGTYHTVPPSICRVGLMSNMSSHVPHSRQILILPRVVSHPGKHPRADLSVFELVGPSGAEIAPDPSGLSSSSLHQIEAA
jgi:hypothetical protein